MRRMTGRDISEVRIDLEKALRVIESELKDIDIKRESNLYAKTLFEKGRALRNLSLISGNCERDLRSSIDCLTESMNLLNRERDPHESSRAHLELGLAYLDLWNLTGNDENKDIAIRAFDEARDLLTYDDDPFLYQKIEDALRRAWRS
jgi:hypothetical protein